MTPDEAKARAILAKIVGCEPYATEILNGENPIYDLSPDTCIEAMLAMTGADNVA